MIGCSEPDNVIYDVFDGVSHGAVVRTLARTSVNFNIFDLNSTFDVTIEAQDEQNGKLLSKMNVYVNFTDNTPGGTNNSKTEVLVKAIEASAFTTSANGLPTTGVKATLAETLTALGLVAGQYDGGDTFTYRLELVLTDGRTFSAADTSGSLQGSYFSSPYAYNAGILCIPPAPIAGSYVINMVDTYGDGWQGSAVVVTVDGTATSHSIPSYWDAPAATRGSVGDPQWSAGTSTAVVPVGASTLTFAFVAGSYPSEVEFKVIGPNSGNVIGDFGPSPVAGEIALNLCNE